MRREALVPALALALAIALVHLLLHPLAKLVAGKGPLAPSEGLADGGSCLRLGRNPAPPSLPGPTAKRMLNRTNYANRNENPNESDLSMSIPFTTYPAYAGAMRQHLA